MIINKRTIDTIDKIFFWRKKARIDVWTNINMSRGGEGLAKTSDEIKKYGEVKSIKGLVFSLDLLQYVRVVDVILYRVCYRVVPCQVIIAKHRPSSSLHSLLLDLSQHLISSFYLLFHLTSLAQVFVMMLQILFASYRPLLLPFYCHLTHLSLLFLI